MIALLVVVLVAALVYLILFAITASSIVAAIGAILVLIAWIPDGDAWPRGRWGGGRR